LEIAVTRVSSKGQVVIPAEIKKYMGIKEGEKLLIISIADTLILKRVSGKTFQETVERVWKKVRELGLTEGEIDALIQEAKVQSSS
jgi:AbrB family looped-hinge helix DNA binding protein